jgi:hypothetical protein
MSGPLRELTAFVRAGETVQLEIAQALAGELIAQGSRRLFVIERWWCE